MIRRDMRKAKNDVRRSKDYNRYHDQEEIAAYENTPTEMEECIDNEDDEMQQAPPNDYNKIPLGVDAPPKTVDFSRKEAMKIDCNTAPPDERATIQEGIPLEKIPQTEKETVPEAASIKLAAPSDTTEAEEASLIESPSSGVDGKGSNIQIGIIHPIRCYPICHRIIRWLQSLIILSLTKPSVLRFLCRMVKPKNALERFKNRCRG